MTHKTRISCALWGLALSLTVVVPLSANTFNVNTTIDAVDATPGDGVAATAAGQCSLRAAVMEANALPGPHTIVLPAGLFQLTQWGPPEDNAVTGDLDLHVETTIVGAGSGRTVIDAMWRDRAFHAGLSPATPLTLRGLTIRYGDPGADVGGAILCPGTSPLTMDDVQIVHAHASDGGAVFHGSGDLTMTDCVIANTSTLGTGGGVYKTGLGQVSVTNCRFSETSAGFSGGALFCNNAGPLIVESSIFEDAHAGAGGGAVYRAGGAGPSTVRTTQFTQCRAFGSVGGAFSQTGGGSVTMEDCTFNGNASDSSGGAAYVSIPENLLLRRTNFVDNGAFDAGGAVYIAGGGGSSIAIVDCSFRGNGTVVGSGGAILCTTLGPVSMTRVQVTSSECGTNGGGIYVSGCNPFTMTDCRVRDNIAHAGNGGGLLLSTAAAATLQRCDFSGNVAMGTAAGGGAMLSCGGGATVEGCLISNNAAAGPGSSGGGLDAAIGAAGTFTNCTFSGNTASHQGGGLMVFFPSTVTNCTFADNDAGFGGAAIANLSPNLWLANTILAESRLGTPNCSGVFVSNGNNIDEQGLCGFAQPTDLNGVNPRIGPLRSNGGAMKTHALFGDSPAIDAGGSGVCPGVDQRGVARPQDGDDNGVPACDIGAFEFTVDCNDNGLDDTAEIARSITPDCNHNGIPDNCESPDVDGDGLYDICDSCIDSDGDGLGDQGYPGNTCPEDGCPTDPTKGEPGVCGCGVVDTDTDGDGLLDCQDNCPGVPNADQADGNGNGIGDACEASPGPQATPGCGACGVGLYPVFPLMLLALSCRRRR